MLSNVWPGDIRLRLDSASEEGQSGPRCRERLLSVAAVHSKFRTARSHASILEREGVPMTEGYHVVEEMPGGETCWRGKAASLEDAKLTADRLSEGSTSKFEVVDIAERRIVLLVKGSRAGE